MAFTFEEMIRSREHRILKRIEHYRSVTDVDAALLAFASDLMDDSETLIGVYINDSTMMKANVFVTTSGFRLFRDEWLLVAYGDIKRSDVVLSDTITKRTASQIRITTQDNRDVLLKISGGTERTRDVWDVLRFINRVVGDYHQ